MTDHQPVVVLNGRQMLQLIAAWQKHDALISFEEDGFTFYGVKFVLAWGDRP